MSLDVDHCYRAMCAKDRRFDGVFFVGVETTGIYCRPICPARTPRRSRCRFFALAAEAERAGFRACFRCRPERAPGLSAVDARSSLVVRSLARIGAGALDRGTVDDLAAELGVTGRHLRRTIEASIGVTPIELAQTRRLGLAKWLVQDTSLPLTEVAFASGHASIRRFNAAFRARFGCAPSALRQKPIPGEATDAIALRLEARPPFAGDAILAFLGARAIPGVERVTENGYRRAARIGESTGWIAAELDGERPGIVLRVSVSLVPELTEIVARMRALFDLDARSDVIDAHLAQDARLSPHVLRVPGLRVPGAFDPWEIAVRAILGQQVSVRAATTLSGRLVKAFGERVGEGADDVAWLFPPPAKLARASIDAVRAIGLPESRAATIVLLAQAVVRNDVELARGADPEAAAASMQRVRGIGEWTAAYVAMRALGQPDAFLGGDLAVKKALGVTSAKDAVLRSESWRPWRAYALVHLWSSLAQGG